MPACSTTAQIKTMKQSTLAGPLLAASAFVLWGLTPLYYRLVPGADVYEMLAQRLIWSVPTLLLVMLIIGRHIDWRTVLADRRSLLLCLLAGLFMCLSWYCFIYAMTHGQVLAASLGFFINPLCSIALGVLFLNERLNRAQAAAVVLGILGVGWQVWHYGELPWLALGMGVAFGFYGMIKKYIAFDSLTSLLIEALLLTPFALGYLFWRLYDGTSVFFEASSNVQLLYILSAPVTLLPVGLFTLAVRRTSLTVVGLIQYIEPSLQFFLAIALFGEVFDSVKAVSFGFIWAGLLLCCLQSAYDHYRPRSAY